MQPPKPPELPSRTEPPEGEPGEYKFHYIDPDQHEELLKAIALRSDDVTYNWMMDLDHLITEDNQLQNARRQPVSSQQVKAVRTRFEEKLGLLELDHCLNAPYRRVRKLYRNLPVPENIINIMIAFMKIGGSVENAILLAQTGHNSLEGTGKNYPLAARHIGYLTGILGWRGDPLTLIKEVPSLFRASVAKRSLLARIALTHGRPPQRGLNTTAIRRVFANPTPEEHIMAMLIRGRHYTFGQTFKPYRRASEGSHRLPWTASEESCWIYDQMRDPQNIELVGPEILRAYLRYKAPKDHVLNRFPHLRDHLPPQAEPPLATPKPTRHDFNLSTRKIPMSY